MHVVDVTSLCKYDTAPLMRVADVFSMVCFLEV